MFIQNFIHGISSKYLYPRILENSSKFFLKFHFFGLEYGPISQKFIQFFIEFWMSFREIGVAHARKSVNKG